MANTPRFGGHESGLFAACGKNQYPPPHTHQPFHLQTGIKRTDQPRSTQLYLLIGGSLVSLDEGIQEIAVGSQHSPNQSRIVV